MSEMLKLMMINTFFLTFSKHPLSFGLILLNQTILTCLLTGLMSPNFWYSYILFLILIGGMLILFIYMTSIASNEKFKFNSNIIMVMMLIFIVSFYLPNFMLINSNEFLMKNICFNFFLSINKYMNLPNMILFLMMMVYLFITLILTVKITKSSFGPLRQKF